MSLSLQTMDFVFKMRDFAQKCNTETDIPTHPGVPTGTTNTTNCNLIGQLFFEFSIENAEIMENCPWKMMILY